MCILFAESNSGALYKLHSIRAENYCPWTDGFAT